MHLYGHHTFVWEKCWEFQTTSLLKPLGQCCSNFMWSPLRLGERKITKMVTIHWPRWPPCPYMVKTFKNLLLQTRGCLVDESLHKSSGMGGLPKLLKWWLYIVVWPFYGEVKFASLCICMGTINLYGKNVENFKRLLWSLWANIAPILCGASLVWGERKIAQMVAVHWPRWLPCPYMVKTFKNLLLQNQISPGALSLHKSLWTGVLPKLLKWWSYIDIWQRSNLLPHALNGPYPFIWEKCWEFIFWTSPL